MNSIVLAQTQDLEQIMSIYEAAKLFMQQLGNTDQWINGYPQREVIARDIEQGHLYVIQSDQHEILGAFALIAGPDPTYARIEGAWLNDLPYGVLHRVAVIRPGLGLMSEVLHFAQSQFEQLRIDTHKDNAPMLHLIRKHGFEHTGTIFVANGTAREAFQLAGSKSF